MSVLVAVYLVRRDNRRADLDRARELRQPLYAAFFRAWDERTDVLLAEDYTEYWAEGTDPRVMAREWTEDDVEWGDVHPEIYKALWPIRIWGSTDAHAAADEASAALRALELATPRYVRRPPPPPKESFFADFDMPGMQVKNDKESIAAARAIGRYLEVVRTELGIRDAEPYVTIAEDADA